MPVRTDQTQEQIELARALGAPGVPDLTDKFNNIGRNDGRDNVVDFIGKVADGLKVAAGGVRRVSLIRDSHLVYPELYLEVFIVQGDPTDEAMFAKMFSRARCRQAKSILEADLVVFTGGEDVDPVLYGEKQHHSTDINVARDQNEIAVYALCEEEGIPMLGICRGAQFLQVMNGGKLYQDVDRHQSAHPMWDTRKKKQIERVSSVHHQLVMDNKKGGMEILGIAGKSTERWLNPLEVEKGKKKDIEAFYYPSTACIGIQGHPEYEGFPAFTQWTIELLEELICHNKDIESVNSVRRRVNRVQAQKKVIN